MLRITQGAPAEHQVIIMCCVAAFLLLAPVVLGSACMLGFLTRPKGA